MAKADSLLRLRVETKEYDDKLKRAAEGIQHLAKAAHDMGGSFTQLDKSEVEFVRNLGDFNTVSKTASGQARELNNAFINLSATYKQFSEEEKNDESGRALASSLEKIRKRAADANEALAKAKEELGSVNNAMSNAAGDTGDFSNVLGQLGSKLGINADLLGAVTTGTVGYVAAVGAAITATIEATKAWADYNAELDRQMQVTTVTTGLSGGDASKLRDAADAMAKVYGVDFRDVINAANILMMQFGKTGDQSIKLLRDGMQGMIAGDGPKMLNMIQQFAPSFRDAGISADQLIAIIHNSEGGLFSEQNMNAILMGIKNIRLMTKSTSDALAQLGLDGEEMSKRMSEGSMTVFEALSQVAEAIEGAKAGSQEAGQVMQQVFGRQGAMQGMKLGRAIAELNTNLAETKRQTGELGKSFAALEMANEMLNESIRNATGWQDMEQSVKNVEAVFVGAVAAVVGAIGDVRNALYDLTGIDVFDTMAGAALNALGPVGTLLDKLRQIAGINITPPDDSTKYNRNDFKNPIGGVINKVAPTSTYEDRPKPEQNQQTTILNQERRAAEEDAKAIEKLNERLKALKKLRAEAKDAQTRNYYTRQIADVQDKLNASNGITTTPKTPKVDTDKEVTIQQQIAALEKEAFTASEERRKEIAATIQELDKELARQKEIRDSLHGKMDIELPEGSLQAMEKELADLKKAQSESLDNYEWVAYQQSIDETTRKISLFKNELPKGEQATFTLNVDDKQLEELRRSGLFGNKNIRVNVDADTDDAQLKLQALDEETGGKTYTITIAADTTDAMHSVQQMTANIEHQQPVIHPKVEMASNLETIKMSIAEAMNAKDLKIDSNTYTNLLQTAIRNGIDSLDGDFSELQAKMGMGINIPDDTWQRLQDELNEQLAELDIEPIKIDFKTGEVKSLSADAKGVEKSFSAAAQAVQSVGSALQGLEDPGAKVAGIVAQAIAQIALGFAQATAASSGAGIFGWIAAIAGGLATMVSTINAIHSATGYAEGGVVEGNSYSLDQQYARLNAGETVLTRAQAGVLASQLEGASGQGVTAQPYVNGEQIWLGLSNYLRRSGRGEVVTSRGR